MRVERIGIATLYLARCEDVLPGLPADIAVVTDNPYGMAANTNSKRFTGGQSAAIVNDHRPNRGRAHKPIEGDDRPFDPAHLLHYPNVVLWGANHFAQRLPVGTTLVWVKKHEHLFGTFLSDCEIGWRKGGHGAYCHAASFPAPARAFELGRPDGTCPHPTQKPVSLMTWCIERERLAPGTVVCDPYMGTGTTGVAAMRLGHRFVGIEMDAEYFEIAVDRLRREHAALLERQRQGQLFAHPAGGCSEEVGAGPRHCGSILTQEARNHV